MAMAVDPCLSCDHPVCVSRNQQAENSHMFQGLQLGVVLASDVDHLTCCPSIYLLLWIQFYPLPLSTLTMLLQFNWKPRVGSIAATFQ